MTNYQILILLGAGFAFGGIALRSLDRRIDKLEKQLKGTVGPVASGSFAGRDSWH